MFQTGNPSGAQRIRELANEEVAMLHGTLESSKVSPSMMYILE